MHTHNIHTCTHTYTQTHTHAHNMHTQHTHTCTHTHVHTHAHTHAQYVSFSSRERGGVNRTITVYAHTPDLSLMARLWPESSVTCTMYSSEGMRGVINLQLQGKEGPLITCRPLHSYITWWWLSYLLINSLTRPPPPPPPPPPPWYYCMGLRL